MNKLNFKNIFYVSLAFHLFTTIFSTGFQHFDEHFQIYEFLNFKLGNIPSSNLPWEFQSQIRPWFQVFIYFLFQKTINFVGITSPFISAFVFRLVTSLLGLYSLTKLYPLIKRWIPEEKYQIQTWAFLNLCWFVPYIQTRTNSESFGASFFILGLSIFVLAVEDKKNLFLAGVTSGIFFGLSYLSRSQMCFAVAFIWIWGLIFNKEQWKTLLGSALSIVLVIAVGALFDFWGYGEWTFSTWNYFKANFLDGVLKTHSQFPWYWYLRWAYTRGIAPISIPIIIATLWGWWKLKKHPLTWATFPFFLFHSYVGHKELRFIFPMILLTPIYLGLFVFRFKDKVNSLNEKKWFRGIVKFIIGVNFLFLIIASFRAANPSANFYQYVWNNPEVKEIKVHGENPYTMLGLPLEFYKDKSLKITQVENLEEYLSNLQGEEFLFFNKGRFVSQMEGNKICSLQYLTYPKWVLKFNIGNWISRSRVWSLYKCSK